MIWSSNCQLLTLLILSGEVSSVLTGEVSGAVILIHILIMRVINSLLMNDRCLLDRNLSVRTSELFDLGLLLHYSCLIWRFHTSSLVLHGGLGTLLLLLAIILIVSQRSESLLGLALVRQGILLVRATLKSIVTILLATGQGEALLLLIADGLGWATLESTISKSFWLKTLLITR